MPWTIFTTKYYGTPIPNTIIAKSMVYSNFSIFDPTQPVSSIKSVFNKSMGNLLHSGRYFEPFFNNNYIYETSIPSFFLFILSITSIILIILGAETIFLKRKFYLLPLLIFTVLFLLYRVIFLPLLYFTWYMVPVISVFGLFLSIGLDYLALFSKKLAYFLLFLLFISLFVPLFFLFPMEAKIQKDVENYFRTTIGKYVAQQVKPGSTIVMEPLGYFGYYIGPKVLIYDYPGLASPTALSVIKNTPPSNRNLYALISKIRPDWLILRGYEFRNFTVKYSEIANLYEVNKHFILWEGTNTLSFYGLKMYNPDTNYYVLRLKTR